MKCAHSKSRILYKTQKVFISFGLLGCIAGCTAVGPDYSPPQTHLSQGWHAELSGGFGDEAMDPMHLSTWWTCFDDPILTQLIDEAVANNLDLKKAQARLREARARRGIKATDRFPTLDLGASAMCVKSGQETGSGSQSDLYSTGFDASWELDIFGGIRRSLEAADADLAASRENVYDVMVSLVAETALNYVELRTFQMRLNIAKGNRDRQGETYKLVEHRYTAGLTSPLDLEQARYNYESTRSEIPLLESSLAAAKNRLAVLLGQVPGSLNERLAEHKSVPVATAELAVGVPAEMLRRRPDVRRAERELAAQTAQIGVATAELYPKFRLLGSIGLESLSAGTLLNTVNRTYSYGPGISWQIFNAGRVQNSIEVENARQEQAMIAYRAAILGALEDVENALTAYSSEQERRKSLHIAAQSAEQAVTIAKGQYHSGLVGFSSVLEAERALLSYQDKLAASDAQVTSNLIRLYKSLGGGWQSFALQQHQ